MEIKILEAYSGTLADQVIAGALDFAICNRPASQTELKLRLLHRDRVILVSGPTKKLTPWKPCRLGMPDLKLVLPSSQHSLRRVLDKHIKAGRIKPTRIMEMDGLGATMRFVQSSDWSTTLPSVAVIDDAKSDTFIMSPIASPRAQLRHLRAASARSGRCRCRRRSWCRWCTRSCCARQAI